MGQIANQMLIEAIFKLKDKIKGRADENKNKKKENKDQKKN